MAPETRVVRSRRALVAGAAFMLVSSLLAPTGPAYAVDGVIQGTVSSSLGGDLEAVNVRLFSDVGGSVEFVTNMLSDGNGEYEFTGLAYGDYIVEFWGGAATPPHANQFHDGTYSLALVAPFAVGSSTPVVRNVTLQPGATLSGTVLGESGPPANGVVLLFHYVGGLYTFLQKTTPTAVDGSWSVPNLPPGDYSVRYTDLLPSATNYRTQYHDQILSQGAQDFVSLPVGGSVDLDARMTEAGPIPTDRLAGTSRYDTAIAVSSTYDSFNGAAGSYVYVASGTNYPDALSAAPAAAQREAPLLLTPPSGLLATVAAEIERLDPERIIVAGSALAVSNTVFSQLQALIDNPANVERIGGASRYETSRLLVEDAFDNANAAFVATGRNFPDALAAGAAAARVSGPVILIDGAAATVDPAVKTLIDDLGVSTLYVAGGPPAVSVGVYDDLATTPGLALTMRLSGPDRYATSLAINEEIFDTAFDAYLATGTGFADALAGAALAGKNVAPLYTLPRTCIPGGVLAHFRDIEVDELYLLGSTVVLSAAVENLTRC